MELRPLGFGRNISYSHVKRVSMLNYYQVKPHPFEAPIVQSFNYDVGMDATTVADQGHSIHPNF